MTDFEVLSRIIWAEAESEILTGKISVAASVLNQSSASGETIFAIIAAPGQFESYANNRFWQAPFRSNDPMMVQSRQAATRALEGSNPIFPMTHFCAYRKNPCRWHYSQTPPLDYVGNHLFIRSRAYPTA